MEGVFDIYKEGEEKKQAVYKGGKFINWVGKDNDDRVKVDDLDIGMKEVNGDVGKKGGCLCCGK